MSCQDWKLKKAGEVDHTDEVANMMKDLKLQKCTNCAKVIQRSQGCNHMTCVCGYEFCYICGAKWETCEHDYFDQVYDDEDDYDEEVE